MESINFYDAKWVRSAGLLLNYIFMSVVFDVRCFRCFHVRVFQFFKAGTSRLGTAYGDFDFSKAGFRASKPSAAVFIFHKPALCASKTFTTVSMFFKNRHFIPQNRLRWFWFSKSRRFTPQYRLQRSQFIQKLAIRAAKTLFAVRWKKKNTMKRRIQKSW